MTLTAGLVLAAGLGSRFGARKLLAPIHGRPMLQHVLDLAGSARLAPIVVVLGADAAELEAACRWRGERRVVNLVPAAGLAGSIKLGLEALEGSDARRAAVLLGDQPFLRPDQLELVLAEPGAIVVPRYAGMPGNPVVLERSVWALASTLEGDRGFSQLFAAHASLVHFVDVPGDNRDIDTPGDLDGG